MAGLEQGHRPVMVEEVMMALSPVPGQLLIDATIGGGGHAVRILEANSPDGRLLGLDADQAAIARCGERLAAFGQRATLRQANFEAIAEVAEATGFRPVDGILFDLGLSSFQLGDEGRGFSFHSSGPLDLRFDANRGRPAAELLADLDEQGIVHVLRTFGEEPHARRIARAIVEQRPRGSIRTASDLASLVGRVVPTPRGGRRRRHPATRTFQALRIAVNRELEVLPTALASAMDLLRPGGRLAVLAYHSLEDRIVKRFMAAERRGCTCPPEVPVCVCGRSPRLRSIGPTPGFPSDEEVASNPRARSARLRAAERIAA
ncbi:MAG: 16S rRNA (cytosine(1402)-N(4))-methyltransferase RsmH [Candidatus Limnocylindrales bacterium]